MRFEEKVIIGCPVQRVWDFVMDPKAVGPCIPGFEKVEVISDREFTNLIKAKVGVISVRFKIKTIFEEIVPYKSIRTAGDGSEIHNLGHFKQKSYVIFSELSENETEVSGWSEISLVGRIATFGERIIRAKAKETVKEFVETLRKRLE